MRLSVRQPHLVAVAGNVRCRSGHGFIVPSESFADVGGRKRDEPNDDRGAFEPDGAWALELSGQSPSGLDRASNDPLTDHFDAYAGDAPSIPCSRDSGERKPRSEV